ncbi:MAG: MrpF/PhaF family protein [Candidatus Bipolaricaulota bacterium]
MPVLEGILLASLALVLVRLAFGPSPWDRLMAANSASTRVVLLICVAAVLLERPALLDVALVYAALSFLGVVIMARTLERPGGTR